MKEIVSVCCDSHQHRGVLHDELLLAPACLLVLAYDKKFASSWPACEVLSAMDAFFDLPG